MIKNIIKINFNTDSNEFVYIWDFKTFKDNNSLGGLYFLLGLLEKLKDQVLNKISYIENDIDENDIDIGINDIDDESIMDDIDIDDESIMDDIDDDDGDDVHIGDYWNWKIL